MSNMNFNCDVCGREVYGCTFVNGMKFCAKCYQETFGETDKDRKIADLQSQLAEREKDIEDMKHFKITIGTMENNQVDISSTTYIDQDKISFAIEQLEKVKELLNTDFESIISWIDPYEYGECLNSMTYNHKNTIEIIDNQINELKRFFGDRK